MTSNIGNSNVDPDPSVHNVPAADSAGGTLNSAQIVAEGNFILDSIIGAVAIALGNVSILGVKPLAFLSSWGEALETKAANALANAQTAQTTATTAQNTSNNIIDTINTTLAGTTGSGGDTDLLSTAVAPLTFIGNLARAFDTFTTQVLGRIAVLESGATATAAAGSSLVGGTDPCNAATNFTTVSPTATLQPTGWGALYSPAGTLAIAHHTPTPSTSRPRVGFQVKARTPGYNWVHICAASNMSLFVALLLNVAADGQDTVQVVTGTGPSLSDVTPQTPSYPTRIANESFWEIAYDPYADGVANSNTFYVFCNGKPVNPLEWQDNGNIAMHSTSYEDWGVMADGGFSITQFTYQDWTGADPQ